jgi:sensor domain CHASE-containing protein
MIPEQSPVIKFLNAVIVALLTLNLWFVQKTISKVEALADEIVALKIKVALIENSLREK